MSHHYTEIKTATFVRKTGSYTPKEKRKKLHFNSKFLGGKIVSVGAWKQMIAIFKPSLQHLTKDIGFRGEILSVVNLGNFLVFTPASEHSENVITFNSLRKNTKYN